MNILDRIKQTKLDEVAARKRETPLEALRASCEGLPPARGFAAAIRAGRTPDQPRQPGRAPRVIAEVKKASPSAGVIRPDFDPVAIARSYAAGGAACISCLTDEPWFQGRMEYLEAVCAEIALPVLRKDFMLDPYQVWEARRAGADCILLIAGFVSQAEQLALRATAREAGLDVLMEIHHPDELAGALAVEPDLLGINNRNLRDEGFVTDLATTIEVAPNVPPALALVSESGIRTAGDVARVAAVGIDGILVGEHLMREPDPGRAIREKLGL
jgi:indole-3-glycerol phosphate synthase